MPCTELAWQLYAMQTLLAAATEQVRAAFLHSLGHASDELRQITHRGGACRKKATPQFLAKIAQRPHTEAAHEADTKDDKGSDTEAETEDEMDARMGAKMEAKTHPKMEPKMETERAAAWSPTPSPTPAPTPAPTPTPT